MPGRLLGWGGVRVGEREGGGGVEGLEDTFEVKKKNSARRATRKTDKEKMIFGDYLMRGADLLPRLFLNLYHPPILRLGFF